MRRLAPVVVSLSLLAAQNASELAGHIALLGSDAPLKEKQAASRKLVEAGKAAIPLLIGALRDRRVYQQRDIANRMNLPANAPPPEPKLVKIPVGDRCRDLLYEIVTPAGSPVDSRVKVYSEQILQVDDWDGWWAANRHKSLAAIHAELKPLVDEYWIRHGTTQNVRQAGEPAEWESGIPIPKGALASGNDTRKVYDIAATVETVTAFYAKHLPGAKRTSNTQGITFSQPGRSVMLTRLGQGTRVIVSLGPR